MATINQVRRGLEQYIDAEILPHLSTAKAFGVGVYMELLLAQIEAQYKQYLDMPAIKMLNLADDNGNIDIGRLRDVAMTKMPDRIQLDVPFAGRFTFTRDDVDRLATMIQNA